MTIIAEFIDGLVPDENVTALERPELKPVAQARRRPPRTTAHSFPGGKTGNFTLYYPMLATNEQSANHCFASFEERGLPLRRETLCTVIT